jgi:hypothetical protein
MTLFSTQPGRKGCARNLAGGNVQASLTLRDAGENSLAKPRVDQELAMAGSMRGHWCLHRRFDRLQLWPTWNFWIWE